MPSGLRTAAPCEGWVMELTCSVSASGSLSLVSGEMMVLPSSATLAVSSLATGVPLTCTVAVGPVDDGVKLVPLAAAVLDQSPGVAGAVVSNTTVRLAPTGTEKAPDQVRPWPA